MFWETEQSSVLLDSVLSKVYYKLIIDVKAVSQSPRKA